MRRTPLNWALFFVAALTFGSLRPALAENATREMALLSTTDSSGLNVGEYVVGVLGQGFQSTGLFSVRPFTASLSGYTPEALAEAYGATRAELISFAYVDRERVALFLFDINRPGRYIATSETLVGSPTNTITPEWLSAQMYRAFTELMKQYQLANFELIPSGDSSSGEASKQPEVSRSEKGRRLFQEMAKLQDGRIYLGVNVGMARFSAAGSSSSTVTVGGYGGIKVEDRIRLEIGGDIYTYLMFHADLRYQLPIAERYVFISLGATVSHLTAVFSQNRGFNPTALTTGGILYGPCLSFDVPLLGASVRGDVRLLLGSSTVFMGTYGLSYAL